MEKDYSLLLPVLECIACKGDLVHGQGAFVCGKCSREYPIIEGVPRFVPESSWKTQQGQQTVQNKTNEYFGFEWDYFRDWGFIPDDAVAEQDRAAVFGGTVSARMGAFESKCRMTAEDLLPAKVILDAGCGNGRYTHEAGVRTDALVIGVDIGQGSVASARSNTRTLPNVFILQADLFDLPLKDRSVDSCFSNGVLMHTGDAPKAFREISRTVRPGGVLVVHVYNRLNPVWEFNDRLLRAVTTRLSVAANLRLAAALARVAAFLQGVSEKALQRANLFLRLQSTTIHMFDWYAAPVATHHTLGEVKSWFLDAGYDILEARGESESFWFRPWACNVKGRKRTVGTTAEVTKSSAGGPT